MKKLFIIISFILSLIIISGCTNTNSEVALKSQDVNNTDDSWTTIENNGIIKFAISPRELPFITEQSSGNYQGYFIDVSNEVSKRLGIKAKYVEVLDGSATDLLENGDVDVILNGYNDMELNNNETKWLTPFLKSDHILVCNNYSNIKSKSDLEGQKVGVVYDTKSDYNAQNDSTVNNDLLVKFDTEKEAIIALRSNAISALSIDSAYFYYYEKYNTGNYNVLDEIISSHTYSLGVKKTDNELASKLESVVADMINDKTLEKISNKWFNKDLSK